MRALTGNEIAILKDKLQAGAQGHSQKVLLTTFTPTGTFPLYRPNFPWGCVMPNGQPALLYSAYSDAGLTTLNVYFEAYINEHALREQLLLFSLATAATGLVNWNGLLVAIAYKLSTTKFRVRTSTDGGYTWSAETDLMSATFAQNTVGWGGADATLPAVHFTTNKAGTTLYLFYIRDSDKHVMYRTTTNADPTTGWSTATDSGFAIPSLKRNYGGSSAWNQGVQRAFAICETKTAGTWIVISESDDGDWHANHMAAQGTLGGTWTRKLNTGYGGGLSGKQGANGGIFLDRNNDLVFYVMADEGTPIGVYKSADSGSTWTTFADPMNIPGNKLQPADAGGGIGAGFGMRVPLYSSQEYAWGGHPDLSATGVLNAISQVALNITTPDLYLILGVNARNVVSVGTTTDVSDRVISISLDKATELDSDSFNIELNNEDGALNINRDGGAGSLADYALPNVHVSIYQWHGVVANSVRTFRGITDSARQHDSPRTVVLVGRDMNKKLLTQEIRLIAPQDLTQDGYVRDMSNFVFLSKTLNEVLNFVLDYASTSALDRNLYPSTYVLKELRGSDGQRLIDFVKRACDLAGMEFYVDEDGIYTTVPIGHVIPTSAYTFRSKEDIVVLDPDVDDDALKTRVRIYGKSNIGAKYLAEIFKWPGLGAPAGIAYDRTTGHVWYLDQNSDLYRLNPAANMAIVEGPHALGLGYPDGIDVDDLDGNLWISDGYNATLGNNSNRKFKKINRSTQAVMLGPFTNADGDHCDVYAWNDTGTTKIVQTTYTSGAIVIMNSTTGAEISRVTSPVANPTAIDDDTGGGYFLVGWDAVEFYQVDHAGNIVNRIAQPDKNSNEIGTVDDPAAFDFGSVYAVFRDQNVIVKYAPVDPTGVATQIYAEAVDVLLELSLLGEIRLARITDLAITDISQAVVMANRQLDRLKLYGKHISVGVLGNPGIQKGDRVTIVTPGAGLSSDWQVRSARSDQVANTGSWLMVLVLIPYVGLV